MSSVLSRAGRAFVVLALACAPSACGDRAEREGEREGERESGPRADVRAPKAADARPLRPVKPDVLIECVPKEVGEWRLRTVVGDEHPLGRGTITSALATYERPLGDKTQKLALGVIDGAKNSQAYTGFSTAWATKLENQSLGYSHLEFGADRAVQILSRYPLTVQIHLLVAERYLVQLDSEKIEPEDAVAFLEQFPLPALRALE